MRTDVFLKSYPSALQYRKRSNFQGVQIFVDFMGTSQTTKINFRRILLLKRRIPGTPFPLLDSYTATR